MNNFVTILTFTYAGEASIVRGRLESEGIECFLKDELTVQVNPLYSNAIGGVKLQVRESDVQAAKEILSSEGYVLEEGEEIPDELMGEDEDTSPATTPQKIGGRGIVLLVIAGIVAVSGSIYFKSAQGMAEQLDKRSWCIDEINHSGQLIKLSASNGNNTTQDGSCADVLTFKEDGSISLPGDGLKVATGQWKLVEGKLYISNITVLPDLYEGNYSIDLRGNQLVLKSVNSTIRAHKN